MPSATRRIGVIGAGISGIVTAAHLKKENLDVTVYERSAAAGGVWLFDERKPLEPAYPPVPASQAGGVYAGDMINGPEAERLRHAPPGPCYAGLKNNVSTRLLQTTLQEFPKGTEDFVTHDVLKDYIQTMAVRTGVQSITRYNTEVKHVEKVAGKWIVDATTLSSDKIGRNIWTASKSEYDAVVVASGHYHAAKVPNTPGLADWKAAWPDRISHSKSYRTPHGYAGKTILLIGGSVSAIDIARDLSPFATTIYQSHRNGPFDLPPALLPKNATRIHEVTSYNAVPPTATTSTTLSPADPIPSSITLTSGHQLCNIHHIILCTGYTLTLPFLPHLHADTSPPHRAPAHVLVTDGSQFHNLHRDMFYIPDPSLCFIGIPFFTATFSLFEFQAVAVAKVLAGLVALPSVAAMRAEYVERVGRKGVGRGFHSLREGEVEYVDGLVGWVNGGVGEALLRGHTAAWHVAKGEQVERVRRLFAEGERVGEEVDGLCW